ncbi:Abi family protein [Aerococcus mictus]|uniref:Abi family protein n=1 Tax=Aerococcus mictus TaxID=2976810 RepID=UPI002DD4411C|nr:Abi family protein [Aerococcus mictus]
MLKTEELIDKLKSKGITFKHYSENDAINFLNEHNYYVKLTAYKTNFPKHKNKYVGLDFKALIDLSTIDMYLKRWILSASLSVEHSLKVNLLKDIQERGIDEYEIVKNYRQKFPKFFNEIERRGQTVYVKKLFKKYNHPNYPVWAFLEIIPFGEFANFYRYYCTKYSCGEFDYKLLYKIRNIRNAAAHNNCIIHDLVDKGGYYEKSLVYRMAAILPNTKRGTIQNRLKNNSIQDFISLLIGIDIIIKSNQLKKHFLEEIKALFEGRMIREAYLYKSAPGLQQMYAFCKETIDKLQK